MRLRWWRKPRLCSTCGQRFAAPPCAKSPTGAGGHTTAGGVGSPSPYALYDVAEPEVERPHYG